MLYTTLYSKIGRVIINFLAFYYLEILGMDTIAMTILFGSSYHTDSSYLYLIIKYCICLNWICMLKLSTLCYKVRHPNLIFKEPNLILYYFSILGILSRPILCGDKMKVTITSVLTRCLLLFTKKNCLGFCVFLL